MRASVIRAIGLSLMVAAVGAAAWFVQRGHRGLWLFVLVAAGTTLLCPVDLVPLARSLFLGSLLGAGVALVRRRKTDSPQLDSSVSTTSVRGLSRAGLGSVSLVLPRRPIAGPAQRGPRGGTSGQLFRFRSGG